MNQRKINNMALQQDLYLERKLVTVEHFKAMRQNLHLASEENISRLQRLGAIVRLQFAAGQENASFVPGVTNRGFADLESVVFEVHLDDELALCVHLLGENKRMDRNIKILSK